MKRNLIFVCLLALLGAGLFAQQQPVVAVAPFDAISGISATDASMITRVFFIRLGNTSKVSLVDRNVVDRILKEHSFQSGDWSNQQKTAELGKALNSDWIVRGELEKFGTNILLTVQFYDIQTFRFMGGADLLLDNAADAMNKMDPLVNKLVETIASSGSQPRQQQGGATGASAYYGTWLQPSDGNITLTIDEKKVVIRYTTGGSAGYYAVIDNITWTAENNSDTRTLSNYPRGFKVSGVVIDKGKWSDVSSFMPIFIYIHKDDKNKIIFYPSNSGGSELQSTYLPWNFDSKGPWGKVQ